MGCRRAVGHPSFAAEQIAIFPTRNALASSLFPLDEHGLLLFMMTRRLHRGNFGLCPVIRTGESAAEPAAAASASFADDTTIIETEAGYPGSKPVKCSIHKALLLQQLVMNSWNTCTKFLECIAAPL